MKKMVIGVISDETGNKPDVDFYAKRKRILGRLASLFIILICLCVILFCLYKIFGRQLIPVEVDRDYSMYVDILNDDEKEEWDNKAVEFGKAFIQLNQNIVVNDGDKAEIRLINPPYTMYTYDMNIVLEGDKGETICKVQDMKQKTIEKNVKLNRKLDVGEYNAKANFVFFDEDDEEIGHYSISITLISE